MKATRRIWSKFQSVIVPNGKTIQTIIYKLTQPLSLLGKKVKGIKISTAS
jgi:hypothetical protein